jgi:hypothetical protein
LASRIFFGLLVYFEVKNSEGMIESIPHLLKLSGHINIKDIVERAHVGFHRLIVGENKNI